MEFGCCSSFKECSEVGFCISKIKEIKDNCLYRKRLEQGFNFYSDTCKKNKLYITLGGRQFYIGRRSSHGSHTYGLDKISKNEIKLHLDQLHINYSDEIIFPQCQVEVTADNNRAYCIVIATINNQKYNIQNFNIRALTKETASSIKNFLVDKGITAYIEGVGRKSTSTAITDSKKNHGKVTSIREHKKDKDNKYQNMLSGQLSIFDLQESQDLGCIRKDLRHL